ncbi:MAG: phosphoribosylanthranilate isomerase [Alphaproteobacteria bacterium]|nr:phosphoribosylanthranilate isomerase [Alphaproteobacteria bacterium]MBV9903587.1 phosphoribosylanthranilate isomerase [Alphaproteobacteria bacterium]
MGVKVKICGITSAEAADAALRAGAEFCGLMFHPKSSRNLNIEQAQALARRMRGRTHLVAVLSNPDDALLAGVLTVVRPDFVQLHGSEPPERVAEVTGRFKVPVIKVFPIAEPSDFERVTAYNDAAEMFMFDAKAPAGATREGGHGAAFDWQMLSGRKFARPWLLAGGLNAENVARAVRVSEAPMVDVSSGVETAPGMKSPDLIAQFMTAARNAQYGAAA